MSLYQKGGAGVVVIVIIVAFTAIIGGTIFYFFSFKPAQENATAREILAQERENEQVAGDVNSTEQAAIRRCVFEQGGKSYRAYFHGPRERLAVLEADEVAELYINDGALLAYYNFEKKAWAKAKEVVAIEVAAMLTETRNSTSISCDEIPFTSDLFRRADNPETLEKSVN